MGEMGRYPSEQELALEVMALKDQVIENRREMRLYQSNQKGGKLRQRQMLQDLAAALKLPRSGLVITHREVVALAVRAIEQRDELDERCRREHT